MNLELTPEEPKPDTDGNRGMPELTPPTLRVDLIPEQDPWRPLIDSLDMFTDDFMEDRVQPETGKANYVNEFCR